MKSIFINNIKTLISDNLWNRFATISGEGEGEFILAALNFFPEERLNDPKGLREEEIEALVAHEEEVFQGFQHILDKHRKA